MGLTEYLPWQIPFQSFPHYVAPSVPAPAGRHVWQQCSVTAAPSGTPPAPTENHLSKFYINKDEIQLIKYMGR